MYPSHLCRARPIAVSVLEGFRRRLETIASMSWRDRISVSALELNFRVRLAPQRPSAFLREWHRGWLGQDGPRRQLQKAC